MIVEALKTTHWLVGPVASILVIAGALGWHRRRR